MCKHELHTSFIIKQGKSYVIKQGKSYVNRIMLVGLVINKTKRIMLIVFDRSASGQEAYLFNESNPIFVILFLSSIMELKITCVYY